MFSDRALQAHYIEKGKLFDTFCGTLEYCAPEVLMGNPYAGKELDMFALGVTLFTLVFGERPFFDVEETIAGVLCPPFEVNGLCSSALLWILDCDPKQRATAQEMMAHDWVTKVGDLPSSCQLSAMLPPTVHCPPGVVRVARWWHVLLTAVPCV